MTSNNVSRPVFKETDVLSHLAKEYGLKGNLKPLPSERDQNFLLTTYNQIQYVCKIAKLDEDEQHIQAQNVILRHLHKKNDQLVSKLILNARNEDITKIKSERSPSYLFRVVSYLPGMVSAEYKPHSSDFMYALGEFMAEIRIGLEDINLKVIKKPFDWDLEYGLKTIEKHKECINDSEKLNLIESYLQQFESRFIKDMRDLEEGIIHGDANDYNVIVQNPSELCGNIKFGLIDFGDFVYSRKIADLAVAIAYAILDKTNPMTILLEIVKGYSSKQKINEKEMSIIFHMVLMRLCISVSMSAFQRKREPDNEYLSISEKPAWDALNELSKVSPNYAYYLIRYACGYDPHPNYNKIINWLESQVYEPIFDKIKSYDHIDLSIGSLDIAGFQNADSISYYTNIVQEKIEQKDLVVGRYAESRLMYLHKSFQKDENDYSSWRSVHLGMDLFKTPETVIRAPLSGVVFQISIHDGYLDYGPTVILKHNIDATTQFFTMYGHLLGSSIENLQVGQLIEKGESFAKIGYTSENGSWPPHVHVQIILDLLNYKSSFPGVCSHLESAIWLNLCPNPNLILNLEDLINIDSKAQTDEIIKLRDKHSSPSMSISYQEPLHIVRGFAQYLYDINGRRYLDAVNNVPTVGHSNQTVLKAHNRQAGVLNTNTRYLNETLVSYSKKLLSYFPGKLDVCFFVNSGSEANELALRLATTYTSRDDFIVLDHAYHGNTNSAISISPYKFNGKGGKGKPSNVHIAPVPYPYRGKYQGQDTGPKYVDEVKKIVQKLDESGTPLAAFIAESLPGVGGQIIIPDNYFPNVYKIVREAGGVCIADEVQVGFARMGSHYWGFEIYNVVPDIVTLGKPIGNGHPIGAVVTTREIAEAFANGMEFFSTTGGNTASMAVGLSVLEVIEREKLQENSKIVGEYLLKKLTEIVETSSIIGDVRGQGLFLGIEIVCDKDNKTPAPKFCTYIVEQMKCRGILLSVDGPDHNVIKIKPPLVFTLEDAEILLSHLISVLSHSCLK